MKKIVYGMAGLLALSALTISCQKKFDANSYAPKLNIGGFTAANEIAATSLVSYFGFNGNLSDSISRTTGTNTGTTYTIGIKGQAMQGALNSYVTATPNTSIAALKSFTITEWINTPPPTTGILGVFSLVKSNAFWGNIELFIENGSTNAAGKLRLHIAKGTNDYTFAVDNALNLFDKWTAIAVEYDATTGKCKLYVNGSKVNEGTATTQINGATVSLSGDLAFTSVGNIVLGTVQFMTTPSSTSATTSQPWASYLVGKLDEVRVYNKALTDAEVNALVLLEGRGK